MTIENRLEALERGLSAAKRRNRYLLVGLVVLAVIWAFTSIMGPVQAKAGENIIRAEGFELVDSHGHTSAVLGVTSRGPVLGLYDENGELRVGLTVFNGEPGLSLLDENGKFRAVLDVTDFVGPRLLMRDENGQPRASMVIVDGEPRLYLDDENGRLLWSAP